MKRTFIACVAVAFGATAALAASPEVAKAIKTIQSVDGDAAKMKQFCALLDAGDDEDEGAADGKQAPAEEKEAAADEKATAAEEKEDAAQDAEIDKILAGLGPDFTAAWEAGADLDETSADGKEYVAAVDGVAAKCE